MRTPLTRAWMAAGGARARLRRGGPPREELVRRWAPGRSFADVGCMWSVEGRIAFLAQDAGATTVTGVDVMPATERFRAERERRDSQMRFVQGDVHDPAVVEEVGPHDVVWCFGVLYHAPHPLLTLERLRALCGEVLLLGTEVVPELPGVDQGCVFYPGLPDPARRAYAPPPAGARAGLTTPFDPAAGYGNWWWGISPSALRAMVWASGFEVEELRVDGLHATVVARPRARH